MSAPGPALALVEVGSMARAYLVLDQLAKRARVSVLAHREVTPGKTIILFGGDEEETLEAYEEACRTSSTHLVGDLLLVQAHPSLWRALSGTFDEREGDAACAVELAGACSCLRACDRALKAARVQLVKMHLCRGIGGRALFVLAGELDQIEAAAQAAGDALGDGELVDLQVVSRPHPEVWGFFCAASGFRPL